MNSVARPRGWPRNSREADAATELVLAVELNVVYPSVCASRAASCAECDPTLRAAARLEPRGAGATVLVSARFFRGEEQRPAALAAFAFGGHELVDEREQGFVAAGRGTVGRVLAV